MNKLYFGDNLEILREMPDARVHLICTDPPFNSGRDYNTFLGDSLAQKKAFKDLGLRKSRVLSHKIWGVLSITKKPILVSNSGKLMMRTSTIQILSTRSSTYRTRGGSVQPRSPNATLTTNRCNFCVDRRMTTRITLGFTGFLEHQLGIFDLTYLFFEIHSGMFTSVQPNLRKPYSHLLSNSRYELKKEINS